jgi:L-ascorbate metabolism protein UlaG (beta-lactamase superfamily)
LPKNIPLQLTLMGHSAVRIEHDDFVTVIDPGALSAPDAAAGADALLITHEHPDHYDVSKIAAAAAAHPRLQIWTNTSVAALLEQSGAAPGAIVHVIGDGDAFDVGGIPVQCHGQWHGLQHPDLPPVRNTGFLLDGRVFHPGDAMTDPRARLDVLLCPIDGFFTKASTTVDYIRQLQPAQVTPVHDATLSAYGLDGSSKFFAQNPPPGPGTDAPYVQLTEGKPTTV